MALTNCLECALFVSLALCLKRVYFTQPDFLISPYSLKEYRWKMFKKSAGKDCSENVREGFQKIRIESFGGFLLAET